MVTWVIGSGGLLGGAVSRALQRRPGHLVLTSQVPWPEAIGTRHALACGVATMTETARRHGVPWRIAWCAGAGVTGTAAGVLQQEITTFADFLEDLAGAARTVPDGRLFLASSAGGAYAGAVAPPFTEAHVVAPLAAYGHAKLAAEAHAQRFAAATGVPVIAGRIANLYGPGQNLDKAQGLISQLCRAQLTGQPASIYVSLDTVRDYLFVDDCAAMVTDALLGPEPPGAPWTVKILASQQGITIAALIGECRRLFKRNLRLSLGTSANARFQVRDLRLRSVVWPELDRRALTTLPAGISATAAGVLRLRQLARS